MNIVFLALSDNQGLFVQRSDQAVPGISGKNQQSMISDIRLKRTGYKLSGKRILRIEKETFAAPKESRLRAVVLPLWMRGTAGCCRLDTAAGQIE